MVGYPCKQACDDEVADKLGELLDLVTIGLEKTQGPAVLGIEEGFVKSFDLIDRLSKDGIDAESEIKDEPHRENIADEVDLEDAEVVAAVENLLGIVSKKIAEEEAQNNSVADDLEQIGENILLQETDAVVKGILKPSRCRQGSQHHVDFAMAPQFIRAYDAEKDFTAEIKFVEQHPKKVVSYRALYAAQKETQDQKEEQDR
ncbi:uncharacterized protein LOC106668087 [Cimex lectularius]|uniref:Uncharacterized protein n=1 Tax=Cimex lectularius TaxID=79782 RepID=A0A8I6RV88_CIMLE|nr:uncharacterized protein LOC106668087 [Cimex lectularius]